MRARKLWLALAVGLSGGCADTFTPLARSTLDLSVFGYLDASADTQWIRVMPVRQTVPTDQASLDADVTLTNLRSGKTIVLRDSLFRYTYYTDPDIGSEGLWLHNFWTTEDIEPATGYRISIRRGNAQPVEAVVRIPPDYTAEVGVAQLGRATDYLQLYGVENVPFVFGNLYFQDDCGSGSEREVYSLPVTASQHNITVRQDTVTHRPACGTPTIWARELLAVVSEAAWPAGEEYAIQRMGLPLQWQGTSTSIGFVGGILTKPIPYERCRLVGYGLPDSYCRMRYDSSSVVLRGVLTEVYCGDGAIPLFGVSLEELNPLPTGHRVLRSATSDPYGQYVIGGLKPGIPYVVTAGQRAGGLIRYWSWHEDTLVFTPGENAVHDIQLERYSPCSMI